MPWVGADEIYHSPLKSSHRAYVGEGFAGMLINPVFDVRSRLDFRECLATSGVATCVALTLYNSETRSCLIAHFDSANDNNAEAVTEALIASFPPALIDEAFIFHTAPLQTARGNSTSTGLVANGIKSALDSSMKVALTTGEIVRGQTNDIYICSRNGNVGYYTEQWQESYALITSHPVLGMSTAVSGTWKFNISSGRFRVYELKTPLGFDLADPALFW